MNAQTPRDRGWPEASSFENAKEMMPKATRSSVGVNKHHFTRLGISDAFSRPAANRKLCSLAVRKIQTEMITILSDGGLSEFIPQTAAARRENIHRIPHHVSSQQSLNVLTDMLTVSAEMRLTPGCPLNTVITESSVILSDWRRISTAQAVTAASLTRQRHVCV
jgi:hypothetical protein